MMMRPLSSIHLSSALGPTSVSYSLEYSHDLLIYVRYKSSAGSLHAHIYMRSVHEARIVMFSLQIYIFLHSAGM